MVHPPRFYLSSIYVTCPDQPAYSTAIGSSLVRAGFATNAQPLISFPADVARYRDRKFNRTVSYVGYNAYADATTRGQIKKAFEPGTNVVGNWDIMENVLDQIFVGLGVDNGEAGGLGRGVVMTEPVAVLGYTRKSKLPACLFGCRGRRKYS